MEITANRAVALDYRVSLTNGITVDASTEAAPLWYLHGRNNLLPGFEKEVEGLKVGDQKSFKLVAKDAYGEVSPGLVVKVDAKAMRAETGKCVVGQQVTLQDKGGQRAQGRIVSVDKDHCSVDLNHQLAGKDLNFDIRVKEIRPASADELQHGMIGGAPAQHEHEHEHGPGCNHGH
jgi:FKBP-type peptidyl-prolyl cis-trans isomerase SlyD